MNGNKEQRKVILSRGKTDQISVVVHNKKGESFRGVDWIQEISITIRKTTKSIIPNARYNLY